MRNKKDEQQGMFGKEDQQVLSAFILEEVRELRKYSEGNYGELKDALNKLSENVARSQQNVESISEDVEGIKKEQSTLRNEVDNIKSAADLDKAKRNSAWNGPKQALKAASIIFAVVVSALTIITRWQEILQYAQVG